MIRGRSDHQTLIYGLRFAPHCVPPGAVMSIGVSVHREDLVLHAKRGLAPGLHLVSFGEGESQLSDPREWIARLRLNQWTASRRLNQIINSYRALRRSDYRENPDP